jgi:hypothetical protein
MEFTTEDECVALATICTEWFECCALDDKFSKEHFNDVLLLHKASHGRELDDQDIKELLEIMLESASYIVGVEGIGHAAYTVALDVFGRVEAGSQHQDAAAGALVAAKAAMLSETMATVSQVPNGVTNPYTTH